VDRLDTWLNAQRGWRRFGLLLLNVRARPGLEVSSWVQTN
jgi:hypothetical protein